MRRAWIEISMEESGLAMGKKSLSVRRAWIEIMANLYGSCGRWSLSVRRAWIEIRRPGSSTRRAGVALRKESVD